MTASDGNVVGHRFATLVLAAQLELLNDQRRSFYRRIQEILDEHPDREIFTSFPATDA